jgi:hypothetical protein
MMEMFQERWNQNGQMHPERVAANALRRVLETSVVGTQIPGHLGLSLGVATAHSGSLREAL